MTDRSRYVFGAALASMAVGGVSDLVGRAQGATTLAADFTFESSASPTGGIFTTGTSVASLTASSSNGTTSKVTYTTGTSAASTTASVTASSVGPFLADVGTGSAYGVHAATNTVFSRQAGNGSAQSLSASVFAVGDYYEFDVPTSGLQNIMVSFDQGSSSTGPHGFTLEYSLDGATGSGTAGATDFSTFSTYSVLSSVTITGTAGTSTTNFAGSNTAGTTDSRFNVAFDLSGITGLNDDSLAAFRLVDTVAPGSTAGTDRVDNFVVSGTTITQSPEPASVALVGAGVLATLMRRRRTQA